MAIYSVRHCNFCGKRYQPETSRHKHCSPECRFKDIASLFSGDECWNWPKSIFSSGYGQFSWTPRDTRTAHRTSYEVFVGPVPEGLLVIHSCDNRKCFNPLHLRAGTYQDNVNDMMERKRHASFDKERMQRIVEKVTATKKSKYGTNWGRMFIDAAWQANPRNNSGQTISDIAKTK